MKLIVGLGNPGFGYRNTPHNVGFLALRELSKRLGIPLRKRRCKGLFGWGSAGGEKINLFMPQTYMNLSGEAVREISKKEKIKPEDLLVICDDIDLKLGFIRLREKGSSGGHKGLKSIIKSLATGGFPRLRIGIAKDRKPEDVTGFVLRPFGSREKAALKNIIKEAVECVLTWIEEGADMAMARFNRRQTS
ncbi:MAG: aminoacyl-tRNA hydrolase [Candidatus Omnitrophota bacterium]